MRKALNENPVFQIGALAVLALLVGFLLLTRISGKSSESSTATTTTPSAATTSSAESSVAAPSTSAPAATSSVPPTSAPPSTPTATAGSFVAGPGLPAPVVRAYKDDKVVVLLVVRRNGIDDAAVKAGTEALGGDPAVALFVTHAGHIARYSRIAAGVNVDRVPALIILRPRKVTDGPVPEATVSYGFRDVDSIAQAIRNALYKGPTDLPYYPK